MGTAVGVGVVLAILVLLPLGALWAAGRWRDPPRERWGVPEAQRAEAARSPEVLEVQLRRQHGIRDERRWAGVRRAAARGEAAPPGLRAATAEYAAARAEALERAAGRLTGRRLRLFVAANLALAVGGLLYAVLAGSVLGGFYALYGTGLLVLQHPALLRRRLARARAAVAANRPVRG